MNSLNGPLILKGIEEYDDGTWVAFVEVHSPCLGGYSMDHKRCTIVQRSVSPAVADRETAQALVDTVEVARGGEVIPNDEWEPAAS